MHGLKSDMLISVKIFIFGDIYHTTGWMKYIEYYNTFLFLAGNASELR